MVGGFKVIEVTSEFRKTESLMHDFMTATDDLKQVQDNFDDIISALALKLKGDLTRTVKMLLNGKDNPQIYTEVMHAFDELDETLYEAEKIEQNLNDSINSISGLALPPNGTEQLFDILHYEARQLNQLIKDLHHLRMLVEKLQKSKEEEDKLKRDIADQLDHMLTDFSRLQDYLNQNIPILHEIMQQILAGLENSKRYYSNAGV